MPTWPRTSFLGQLSDDTRDAVLRLGTRRRHSAGETIIQEGAPSSYAVILLTGLYKVVGLTEDGREALLAVRIGGDLVGELGLADGEPRIATVRAASAADVIRIGERDYRAMLDTYSDANKAVSKAMADKLRSASRRRVEFATCPTPVRVARVLQELAEAHGVRRGSEILVGVTLTQTELAALVGTTGPTIHRVLGEMRANGILATGYRNIRVLDEEGLDELARM
ncbi:Crp/Fnr family transcriptional regulator [Actinophytocola sp.]|uniref:Crp/Fnr family transcriptional regulator n=1 Tax=Actinophytocola sp. TaxID=1872138 RepID=UPI002ECFC250